MLACERAFVHAGYCCMTGGFYSWYQGINSTEVIHKFTITSRAMSPLAGDEYYVSLESGSQATTFKIS